MSRLAHWVPSGGDDPRGVLRARCGQPLTMVATTPADPNGPWCPHCAVIHLIESEPPRFARLPRPGRPPV